MKKLVLLFIFIFTTPPNEASEPRNSLKYKRDLIRYSRITWGMDAPVALFASQIQQESSWDYLAKSPYADGLTQFTPSTAKWLKELYPELSNGNVYNPIWSIRAMLLYDQWLDKNIKTKNECNQWAMILSSYNGGLGWLKKDIQLSSSKGKNPEIWWNNVELYSSRADWAMKENRNYPKKILLNHQSSYSKWGRAVIC